MKTSKDSSTESSWQEEVKASFPHLEGAIKADVAIVGGGLAGVLSAYLLAKAGKKVVLVEKNVLGSGATAMTTAFLTEMIDTDVTDLIKIHGLSKTRTIFHSHEHAIDLVEKIVREENIDCAFKRCSNFIFARFEKDNDTIEEEYEAMKSVGLDVRLLESTDIPGFVHGKMIEVRNQASFHPIRFLNAVAERAKMHGARIFEHTHATKLHSTSPVKIETDKGMVKAKCFISATYEPWNEPMRLYFKKGMYVSYVTELRFPDITLPHGTFEDTDNPYHYFRVDKTSEGTRVIIGGEDHRQDIPVHPEKNFLALEEYVRELFKGWKYEVVRRWSGPILEPVDGLAFIGYHKKLDGLYAFGFSGNGMTYSAVAAMMFADFLEGRRNEWQEIYDPARIPRLSSLALKGRDYAEEFFDGAIRNTLKYKSR